MTKTFRDLGVDADLCEALAEQGIHTPFPIQELTLPLALDRHDLIGQARTGTGKTLAFGLPLLQAVDASRSKTQALVIVPTRELCVQVHDDLLIGGRRGITSVRVYGGVPYDEQVTALKGGAHVVVGTPGRLLDHLDRRNLDLSNVHVLVLDEADEMLDMGFLPDVERLIEACPDTRQTMLFSATMPTPIVKLARRYLDHPTFTRADTQVHEVAPTVDQHFFSVHRMDKPRVLARILQGPGRGGCFVFVRTKQMADRLVAELEDLAVPAIAIHGDLRQQTRERNLDRFRAGKVDVLVATEVAARGLDVTGVTHVVNYDCPDDEKMYLHRIGRTARAGEAGMAVTFAEFNEVDRLNVIRKAVGAEDNPIEQVFSTSELLTERFGLPDERPWDRAAGATRPRARDGERQGAGRKGQSDGRPKSRRRSEGAGSSHDATRRRTGAQAPAAGSDREEERTRTRTRTRQPTSTTESTPSRKDEAATPATTGRGSARTRSRREEGAQQAQDADSRRSTSAGRRGSGEGGRSRSGEGGRGGSAEARNGSGRGRQQSGGRGDRAAKATDDTTSSSHEAGSAARGAGQPQLSRRVKVEHLP